MSPIVIYTDDTSGNRSKVWNKFDLYCLSMAGLPMDIARQCNNIHFICCSNRVFALDMADALVNELLQLERGITVYDSYLGCNIFVMVPVLCILADNARGSELTNHLGATATKFCRKCMVRACI